MKYTYKIASLILLTLFSFSCSESDLIIDELYDTVDSESGVVLRTIQKPQDLVSASNPVNNFIALEVEIQEGNGSSYPDFKELRANIQLFNDQDLIDPVLDTNGNVAGEKLVATYLPADFETGPNNLPRIAIEMPTSAITAVFPDAEIGIPAFISLRYEIEMNDGRVFTNEAIGASVTGGTYFASSFLYKIIFLNI
ncbi:MAG: hypothetical protein R2776_10105 [Flavobacteriaceae bacterium]